MSLRKSKEQLIRLLYESDCKVIALSGKWGTGKTHLWREIRDESSDDKITQSLYVSLFGLSNIDHVKRKLIEAAIPGAESHGGVFDGLKNLVEAGIKAASEHFRALAALSDLNLLLMAPVVLREKLIVIDDIERKHENLGIDEVLGFIDEYANLHGSRFILVLNNDQLSGAGDQAELWAKFREKVIDQEIRLSTSADEAFSIAIGLTPSKYARVLERASIGCSLTNIRMLVKIIKVANRILGDRELTDAIQARVVPSIVLFSAIHYRGLEDGPDFEFALSAGGPNWLSIGRDRNQEPTADDKRKDRWRMLMQELGILGCDEFENLLIEFLESGLFDPAAIGLVIDGYVAEAQRLEARQSVHDFLKRIFWDQHVDEAALVVEAEKLPNLADFLDPYIVTDLDQAISVLPDGARIGKAIVDKWIATFNSTSPAYVDDENFFNRPLHPAIKAEFAAVKARAQESTTVIDACLHIINHSGWGTLQEVAMRQATARDFELALRAMGVDTLRPFMRRMVSMRLQKETFESHFGTATERFVEACRIIASDPASPRLAGIIKRVFSETTLAEELEYQTDEIQHLP